jgi:hypothetical protein
VKPVEYTIDANDVFVAIDGNWRGRSMWSAVDGDEARLLWKHVLDRVRSGSGDGEMRLRYRCDTPTLRRRFEVVLRAAPDGAVTFTHRPLETTLRPTVRVLDEETPRTDALLRMCSWCGRFVAPDGEWREIDELDVFEAPEVPRVTHGICPDCFERVSRAERN